MRAVPPLVCAAAVCVADRWALACVCGQHDTQQLHHHLKPCNHNLRSPVQGDDVEILIITKEGVRTDRLELKRD